MSPATWALLSGLLLACLLVGEGDGASTQDRRAVGAPLLDGLTHERVRRSYADRDGDNVEEDYTNDEAEDYDTRSNEEEEEEEEEEAVHPPPQFLSKPQNLSLRPGDNVTLECRVTDIGEFVQMWLNGTNTITVGSQSMVSRVTRQPDYSLHISNVQPDDSGNYTCQISSSPMVRLTHTLIIPSPAKIIDHSTKQTPFLGGRLTLKCKAEGRPQPSITWTLGNHPVPNSVVKESGSILEVAEVTWAHAGDYKCTADNSKGFPQHSLIKVEVLSKPEIHVEKELVNVGVGEAVELVCQIEGHPDPRVSWHKDKVVLKSNDRIDINSSHGVAVLRISYVDKGDFGNYTCSAKNKHGNDHKTIVLSGSPSVPKYISSNPGDGKVTLEWEVESFAPIREHELLYRKKGASEWQTLKPLVKESDGSNYEVRVDIPSVTAGEYEAMFRSQNEFGWTNSELVSFSGSDKMAPPDEEASSTDGNPIAAEASGAGNDNGAPISAHNAFTLFTALLTVFAIKTLPSLL